MQAPSTRINPTPASPEVSKQQTAFYAGNPEHDHTYESSVPVPPSRPRMRMRPSQSQTDELRKAYLIDPHPTKEQREELGKRIGMWAILLCLSAYSNLTTLSSGATRVSRIGFKTNEVLRKSDWMMTLLSIRHSISITMGTPQTWTCRLTPETCWPSKRRRSPRDPHILLFPLLCAGRGGRPALNAPMPPLHRGVLLIIVSSLPIV
jgi:hypothetical protein